MNLQKIIIGVTIAAVAVCGVFLGVDKLKSSKNNKDELQDPTVIASETTAASVTDLNLSEPPILLELIAQDTTTKPEETVTISESSTIPQSEQSPSEIRSDRHYVRRVRKATTDNNASPTREQYIYQIEQPSTRNEVVNNTVPPENVHSSTRAVEEPASPPVRKFVPEADSGWWWAPGDPIPVG